MLFLFRDRELIYRDINPRLNWLGHLNPSHLFLYLTVICTLTCWTVRDVRLLSCIIILWLGRYRNGPTSCPHADDKIRRMSGGLDEEVDGFRATVLEEARWRTTPHTRRPPTRPNMVRQPHFHHIVILCTSHISFINYDWTSLKCLSELYWIFSPSIPPFKIRKVNWSLV